MTLADLVERMLGDHLPVRIEFYDGSATGPEDAEATLTLVGPDALRRIILAPGELGLARAYVAGDLRIEGDILKMLSLRERMPVPKFTARDRLELARIVGGAALRPVPPPPEEIRLRGRFHSTGRDSQAIASHYDVSNAFYELLLGPTMTYSCALWPEPDADLERAQWLKYDLVCKKLDLQPGMRLLDLGCGWGSMALHAAGLYGVDVVGVTLSPLQAEYARERVNRAGMGTRVTVRLEDYRHVGDGPFDAVCSIGMLEHVGSDLATYGRTVGSLVRPGGRFLHHAISRPPSRKSRIRKPTFIDRYVFPDADLHEIGETTSAIEHGGLEARHMESLRDHYVLTLRAWLERLESRWNEAVELIGAPRARIWRLYIAAAVRGFEENRIQVHQVLAVNPGGGASGMSLEPGEWRRPQPVEARFA